MKKIIVGALSTLVMATTVSAFNQTPERFEGECFMNMGVRCTLAGKGYMGRYNAGVDKENSLKDAIANFKKGCELGEKNSCTGLEASSKLLLKNSKSKTKTKTKKEIEVKNGK